MITATDSFVKYLAQELMGLHEVRWVRVTPDDEDSDVMKLGVVNVTILSFSEFGPMEEALVSLDVAGTNEREVLVIVKRLRDALLKEQCTREYDFATPSGDRRPTGSNVYWDSDVDFAVVSTDAQLVHYNATITLRHVRQ